jgi:ribonuclease P protein component
MRYISAKKDFDEIYARHKRYPGRFFNLLVCDGENRQTCLVAIIISKRVDKRAVVRNKIKRRVRAFLREWEHNLPEQKKMLIIAKPEAVEVGWESIRTDLEDILARVV